MLTLLQHSSYLHVAGISGLLPMSTMSPNAPSFYPPRDTVESVIGEVDFNQLTNQ